MFQEHYTVIALEDDPLQVDVLSSLLKKSPHGDNLSLTFLDSADELERLVSSDDTPIDILLMDINLGDDKENGIDLVKRLLPPNCGIQVIYITGYVEYCTKAYQTEHVYFLTKPTTQSDFDDAIEKALQKLSLDAERPLVFSMGGHVIAVPPNKINYIESDRRKIRVNLDNEVLEVYDRLSDVAQRVPSSFVQCHKSFLVNMGRITEFGSDSIRLATGDQIPISQRRRKGAYESFLRFLSAQ